MILSPFHDEPLLPQCSSILYICLNKSGSERELFHRFPLHFIFIVVLTSLIFLCLHLGRNTVGVKTVSKQQKCTAGNPDTEISLLDRDFEHLGFSSNPCGFTLSQPVKVGIFFQENMTDYHTISHFSPLFFSSNNTSSTHSP